MTAPATPAALATPDDLTAYLGAPPTNAAQAAWMLDTAAAIVRGYCGWSITQEAATWTLDADGGPMLLVPTLYLDTSTVTVTDNTPATGPVTVDPADYSASDIGVLTRRGYPYAWPAAARAVTVSATHGYATPPREITAVCCAMASRLIATAGLGPVSSYRVGGVGAYYRGSEGDTITVPTLEAAVLDQYRITGGPT